MSSIRFHIDTIFFTMLYLKTQIMKVITDMFHKSTKTYISFFCLFILCLYWIPIFIVNFSGNPDYYNTDMYSDMTYAAEVWKQKNHFPQRLGFRQPILRGSNPCAGCLILRFVQQSYYFYGNGNYSNGYRCAVVLPLDAQTGVSYNL